MRAAKLERVPVTPRAFAITRFAAGPSMKRHGRPACAAASCEPLSDAPIAFLHTTQDVLRIDEFGAWPSSTG